MSLTEVLKQIDLLQQQIDQYPQLGTDLLKKIQYRFRLDWNYHSNALEGNSLTRQETRSVMINNITVEGKPLKDVLEIRGHDNVITEVLRIGKGEKPLSEKRMKDIHKAILHEEDPEKMKQSGIWKTVHNHVINYKGEKFEYANPADVADEIHALLNETNAALENKSRHTVLIAFEFHLKFLTIHPFYDGNGRTARIFMNLLLIAAGYPPLIIKVEEKQQYNRYLADIQCYGGAPDLLYEFLGKLLLRSQELVLDAIGGKDISEQDDFEKELGLIKQNLIYSENILPVKKISIDGVNLILNQIISFEQKLLQKLSPVSDFFAEVKTTSNAEIDFKAGNLWANILGENSRVNWKTPVQIIEKLNGNANYLLNVKVDFECYGCKIKNAETMRLALSIMVKFEDFRYSFYYNEINEKNIIGHKLYETSFDDDDLVLINLLDIASNYLLNDLKVRYKELTGKELLS